MAEHEHKIFHSGATRDPIVPVCSCGKDLMVLYLESEQRALDAEAREQEAMQESMQARLLIDRFARIDVRTLSMAQFYALQGEFRAFVAHEVSNGK